LQLGNSRINDETAMASKAAWIQRATGLLLVAGMTAGIAHYYRSHLQQSRPSAKTPYSSLVKLQRFAELGEANAVMLNIDVTRDISSYIQTEAGVVYNVTAVGESNGNKYVAVPLLALAASKEQRNEWDSLAAAIEEAKKTVDPELYGRFQEVVKFHQEHPWSPLNDQQKGDASGWNSKDISRTWINKNHQLKVLIQRELAPLHFLPQS
jgi:hypothetical protein